MAKIRLELEYSCIIEEFKAVAYNVDNISNAEFIAKTRDFFWMHDCNFINTVMVHSSKLKCGCIKMFFEMPEQDLDYLEAKHNGYMTLLHMDMPSQVKERVIREAAIDALNHGCMLNYSHGWIITEITYNNLDNMYQYAETSKKLDGYKSVLALLLLKYK